MIKPVSTGMIIAIIHHLKFPIFHPIPSKFPWNTKRVMSAAIPGHYMRRNREWWRIPLSIAHCGFAAIRYQNIEENAITRIRYAIITRLGSVFI